VPFSGPTAPGRRGSQAGEWRFKKIKHTPSNTSNNTHAQGFHREVTDGPQLTILLFVWILISNTCFERANNLVLVSQNGH